MVNSGLNEEDCIPPVENALGVALDSELEEQLVFVLEREVEEQTHVETGAGIRPQKERGLKRWLKNSAHLFDLTIGFLGIQVVWTLEMGYGSLYLMELGLSKSVVSLVWLAGPISGLLTQPIVGAISDHSRSKYGRRRPFIAFSTILVTLSLLAIGWTREIVKLMGSREEKTIIRLSQLLAVLAFYVLDFSINATMACLRALNVDLLHNSKQSKGAAWASRMISVGNIFGYALGFYNLVELFPRIGGTQIKVYTVLTLLIFNITMFYTCIVNQEQQYSDGTESYKIKEIFKRTVKSVHEMPQKVKTVCHIQFYSWIGWFPFLFYCTAYIAGIYSSTSPKNETDHELATRAGSFMMLLFSIVSLVVSILLPALASLCLKYNTHSGMSSTTQPENLKNRLMKKIIPLVRDYMHLNKIWLFSNVLFTLVMYLTLLVSTSYIAVTMLLMTLGFCWAVTIWIPYALIGHCLSLNQHDGNREQTNFKSPNPDEYVRLDTEHASEIHNNIDPMNYSNRLSTESEYSSIINGTIHSNSSNDVGSSNSRSGNHPASGAILGAHNIFIVLPQLITAVFSSLVFLFFEKTNDGYADYMSIGHLFRICGTFPLIAAYLCYKY